jgi:curved DNA-binding protein CbpA
MKAHPDRGGTNDETRLVLLAYETLSNPTAKLKYDATLARPAVAKPPVAKAARSARTSPYAGVPSGNPPQWPKGWPRASAPKKPAPEPSKFDPSKIDWDEVIKARDQSPFGNDNVGGQFVSMMAELGRQWGAQAGKKK